MFNRSVKVNRKGKICKNSITRKAYLKIIDNNFGVINVKRCYSYFVCVIDVKYFRDN